MAALWTDDPTQIFLTSKEVADRYQMSWRTVEDLRRRGRGPVATKIGHLVRYSLADVLVWERASREKPVKG